MMTCYGVLDYMELANVNHLEEARKLYTKLPETEKKRLCQFLATNFQNLWIVWIRAAALHRGGHRAQVVAQRKVEHHQTALDKHLFDSPPNFWRTVLAVYCEHFQPELIKAFQGCDDKSDEKIQIVLKSEKWQNYAHATAIKDLIIFMVKLGELRLPEESPNEQFQEQAAPQKAICASGLDAEENSEDKLRASLTQYEYYYQVCTNHMTALAGINAPEVDFLNDFRSLAQAHENFSANVNKATRKIERADKTDWCSLNDARRMVDELIAHPLFTPPRMCAERIFWEETIYLLARCRCSHRLPRRQVEFMKTRQQLVKMLEERLAAGAPPPFPPKAASSGREWLEEIKKLSGEDLETLEEWFSNQGYPAVGDILADLELAVTEEESAIQTKDTQQDNEMHSASATPTLAVTNRVEDLVEETNDQPDSNTITSSVLEVFDEDSVSQPLPPQEMEFIPAASNILIGSEPQIELVDYVAKAESSIGLACETLVECATTALSVLEKGSSEISLDTALAHLGWHLLAEGEPALAWWTSREVDHGAPRPALLEILALVHWSPHHSLPTQDRISELTAETLDESDEILSLSACLIPALLEPESHASQRIASLGLHSQPTLRDLCQTVVDFGANHIPLTVELLDATQNHVEAQNRRNEVLRRLESWWRQAQQVNIISLPAKDVWRYWLGAEGWLNRLVKPLLDGHGSDVVKIQEVLRTFSSLEELGREAERTYGPVLNHRGNLIVRAREQIARNALEGLSLVSEWLRTDGSTFRRNDFREVRTKELRQKLTTQLPVAVSEVRAVLQKASKKDISYRAGWFSLGRTLDILQNLLHGGHSAHEAHDPAVIMGLPLLRCSGIELDMAWKPSVKGAKLAEFICAAIARPLPNWSQARESHLASGDLVAFRRCLQTEREEGLISDTQLVAQEALLADRQKALTEAVQRHNQTVEALLDEALRQGLYNEQDYRDTEAVLSAVGQSLAEGELRFHILFQRLKRVEKEIQDRRSTQQQEAERRLDVLRQREDISDEVAGRIHESIRSDLITAVDFLERVERGDELPPVKTETMDPFARFFFHSEDGHGTVFSRLCNDLLQENREGPSPRQMPDRIRTGRPFGGLQHINVPKPQREEGARFLETWLEVKQKRTISVDEAVRLLTALGFENVHVSISQNAGRCWLDVHTPPLADRQRCPLPTYGSEARGNYRIWCVWTRPSEDDIITAMEGGSLGARIIFHFGSLAGKNHLEQPRRDLARRALERRRRFLLLDDVLAVFLAAEGAPRLRSFIECAAPFSHNEPYAATAGQVPPEMFYGREWEMDQILSAKGSSFLFGGRQLGKTVLLRNAAKTFHKPAEGQLACWLDLKDKGIGTAHSLDKIWEVLGTELKAIGVLPEVFRPSSRPEAFLREVAEWLTKDTGRRILILLDESDDFLNADGVDSAQEFHRCSLIKGLMDRTERRFKVVFAGLHNVQRSTRTANQPLAHFGEPLCIGPMLRGQEAKAAADLVEQPLRACGFIFENSQRSQIITRVLARTNYYPSLIQLFCQKLVEHCFNAGRNRFDQRTSPPWRLTLDHVKAAEKLETVRQSIREKFILTLDLDKRFRLIAFLMAHHDGDHAGGGFYIQEIARKAREWWPTGFASSRSDDVFRDLLEEMVGLGVLRRVSGQGTYALRSPNLVALLGSAAEVEAELLSSINWEVKPEYDPQQFHQTLDECGMQRSPFTAHQETKLFNSPANLVAMVTGCPLSGLGSDFTKRLRLLANKTPFSLIETTLEDEFNNALQALTQRTEPRVVIVVQPKTAWTPSWMTRALAKLSALKSEGKFVTVIFTQNTGHQITTLPSTVEQINLAPWHSSAIMQWFERASLGGDEARHQEVLSATGGWPSLVETYIRERQAGHSLTDACTILRKRQAQEYRRILHELGIDPASVPHALSIAADLAGDIAEDVRLIEIQEFAEISAESLQELLQPIELQGAVTLSEQKVNLNPVLVRCIRFCQPRS